MDPLPPPARERPSDGPTHVLPSGGSVREALAVPVPQPPAFPPKGARSSASLTVRQGDSLYSPHLSSTLLLSLQGNASPTPPSLGRSLPRNIAINLWVSPKSGSSTFGYIYLAAHERQHREPITPYFESAGPARSTPSHVRTLMSSYGRTTSGPTTSPSSEIFPGISFQWGLASWWIPLTLTTPP